MDYQILLFYKYTKIENPEKFLKEHRKLCEDLGLTGRIIIAEEGINSTVEGTIENTEKYVNTMLTDSRFADVHFKRSIGTGNAFPKLSIKVRPEIVSSYLEHTKIDPTVETGKYITPEELHEWINSDKKFYMVDMRNDYEHQVGYFKDSLLAPINNFRDLPKVLPILEPLKGETIVTVCTGGVRCEKASAFLLDNGFNDVYQLYGGIVSYMEKYPNEDFLGKLYVFDGRITMGFNTDDAKHVIVGKCSICNKSADTYRDCSNLHCRHKRHFVACDKCWEDTKGLCISCSSNQASI
jgi:UPF0176 protein